jgi:hypothetical protein
MNTYSRVLKHIDMKGVKQKHQQKIIEKRLKEDKRREEEKYIQSVMENKKCDWRKELNEQMTTADVFFATLPATGDTNLESPNWNILAGLNYTTSNGSVTINGNSEDFSDGFVSSFDISKYDTLVLDVSVNNSLLGVFSFGADALLITPSSGTYSISIPKSLQKSNANLVFLVPPNSGSVTIGNLRYQRRTPMNVFVSLDSPEATSFIRSGTGSSAEERQKYVEDLLTSGKEYTDQLLGSDFPGSNAVMPGSPRIEPGIEVSDFDISKMEKNYGEVAGTMNTPSSATKFMQDLMKDGFGGNEVRTTVNGQRMTGRPAEIIQQIKLNFPGGV